MRILYHGDSPTVATGFGNVSRLLLYPFANSHQDDEVVVIGINERGGWKDPGTIPSNVKIYPAIYSDYNDIFGMLRLYNTLSGTDPEIKGSFDTLILNYDLFLLTETRIGDSTLFDLIKESGKDLKRKIIYTPVDCEVVRESWMESLRWFDTVIVPSYYAKRVLEKYDKEFTRTHVVVMPNPVDQSFHPLTSKEKLAFREAISKQTGTDLTKKYVVGFVGRNQWRKNIFGLVEAFDQFRQGKDALLYLHTHPTDDLHGGGNILEMLNDRGMKLGRDYLTPPPYSQEVGFSRDDLNQIYNFMDVYCSMSYAEGFGLPVIEAMLAGTPVVVPDNTTMPELLGEFKSRLDEPSWLNKYGVMFEETPVKVTFGAIDWMRPRTVPSAKAAAGALDFSYGNRASATFLIDAMNYAAQTFNPDKIAKQFEEIIYGSKAKGTTK